MFGLFRLILALIVVAHHLGGLPGTPAHVAVFAFYTLSGYLMTLILNERYGFGGKGLARYACNRLLRIYPPYYVALAVSLAVIALVGPGFATHFREALRFPRGPGQVARMLTLVGLTAETPSRPVPPAWSLGIEVTFYALIALGLGRSARIAWVWLTLSLAALVGLNLHGASARWTYLSLTAASLPFAVGSLIYWHRERLQRPLGHRPGVALGVAAAAWVFVGLLPTIAPSLPFRDLDRLARRPDGWPLVASVVPSAVLIACLARVDRRRLPSRLVAADQWLGDLSYPVYLVHWTIGCLVARLLVGVTMPTPRLALWALPPILATAWVFVVIIDGPADRIRRAIRPRRERLAAGTDGPTADVQMHRSAPLESGSPQRADIERR